jgi:hypothetical protein
MLVTPAKLNISWLIEFFWVLLLKTANPGGGRRDFKTVSKDTCVLLSIPHRICYTLKDIN